VDDVSEDDIGMNDEILQEMTLEKFEHVSDFSYEVHHADQDLEIRQ
jgi:hypothetical protein